jgi:hypothetical protein
MKTKTSTQHRHQPLFGRLLFGFTAAAALLSLASGCAPPTEGGIEVNETDATNADNGLRSLNGLKARNGLRARNGLVLSSALDSQTGLSSTDGLMSTADGQMIVTYLVKCALPVGHTLVKEDENGVRHAFPGLIGLAPQWESGSCGMNCQESVSACMLALVNASGVHVPLWLMATNPVVGFGQNPAYPHQEGSFFGNLFLDTPQAFYCAGRDYRVNPVNGRIGSNLVDPTYTDRYGVGGACAGPGRCTAADGSFARDGYKACSGWNNVVTVWRQ